MSVLDEIAKEQAKQVKKWGVQNHNLPFYFAILAEEVGEVAKGVVEHTANYECIEDFYLHDIRYELIQTAAVAASIVERIDRHFSGEARL